MKLQPGSTNWRLRSLLLAGLLLSGMISGSGCTADSVSDPEIRIGFLPPSRAEWPSAFEDSRRAAALAIEDLENDGGLKLNGRRHRIVLVERDIAISPEDAVSAAQDLIKLENVVALIGPYASINAIPVATVAESSQIPMIPPSATSSEVERGKSFAFRMAFSDEFQGTALARFSVSDLAASRAAVLFDLAEPHSRRVANSFRTEFNGLNRDVVAFETFTSDASNFGPQLRRIVDTNPEVLLLPTFNSVVESQVRQARELGLTATLLFTDGLEVEDFAKSSFLDGAFQTDHWHPDLESSESREFTESFGDRYGTDPSVVDAALTYDAFRLLFRALATAGSTNGTAVRDAIASVRSFRGVTGEITRLESGSPRKNVVVLGIEGGQVQLQRVFSP